MTTDETGLDLPAIREQYLLLRETQKALNKKLQTMLPKQAFKECGQKLGFWNDGVLFFDREDAIAVFTDYMVYDYRLRRGTNAIERLVKLGQMKPGTIEHEVLMAMVKARFTVLRVVEMEKGTGVTVDDLFHGERLFLADVALSENSEKGSTLASRVLCFPGFVMTTGACFGMAPEFIDNVLRDMAERFHEGLPGVLKKFSLEEQQHLAGTLIRAVLAPPEK
jgi:hypothetical protein